MTRLPSDRPGRWPPAWLSGIAFELGAARLQQLPDDVGREVAFAGRSNAGKSSALNALTGRTALARVSKTPGRTRQVNFFRLDRDRHRDRRIVDLPGYGFARAPRAEQRAWGELIEGYLTGRDSLAGLVLITDSRRPLGDLDRVLLDWCASADIPIHVVLTKADKLARGAALKALGEATSLARAWPGVAGLQLFSALRSQGLPELAARLTDWLDIAVE